MQLKTTARNLLCSIIILTLTVTFPALAVAQEAAPETNVPSETTSSAPAVSQPKEKPKPAPATAKQDKSYKDNGDGTWSNGEYTWNSKTKQTQPNKPQDYSYNPNTGRWDTRDWAYNSQTGRYEPNKHVRPVDTSSTKAKVAEDATPAKNLSVAGSDQKLNNQMKATNSSTGTFDLFFDGSISNSFSSDATSGDALVQGNTQAGDALSGDATAIATLLNLLQSSWLGEDSQIATFINNIDGNVYGDLVIDPAKLPYNLSVGDSDVNVNLASTGVINNDIELTASSGNATVDSNTAAGDATSGDAAAMANVINMINSAIYAGQSFLGMININGTFDGDILLPKGVLEALIASTGSSGSTNLDSNTNRTINNDVTAVAASGDAVVDSNTTVGDAASGSAQTAINSMNLIGQNLIGNNALLVFVNVMGEWVGMIISPSGATLAQTNPGSMNTVDAGVDESVSVSTTEDSLINNRISVTAQSGDARVSNNTTAGDATSGNASATVNLLNMIGSNIEMADWFGVLFINVFGNWFGSFGADTANGGYSQNPPAKPSPTKPSQAGSANQNSSPPVITASSASGGDTGTYRFSSDGQVFGFIPSGGTGSIGEVTSSTVIIPLGPEQTIFGNPDGSTAVKGSSAENLASGAAASAGMNWWLLIGGLGMIATLAALVREYVLAIREEQRLA